MANGAEQTEQRRKGIGLVLLGASLWGASGVAVQFLLQDKAFGPEWLVVVRLLVSGALLVAYEAFKGGDVLAVWRVPYDRRQIVCFGIFGMLSVQYTYFVTILYSNAATATILQYLMPIVMVCYIALRHSKRPSLVELVSVALAMFGVLLIVTKGDFGGLAISPYALLWGIASAFCSAYYTMQPKYLLSRWPAPVVVGWGLLTGGAAMGLVYPPWTFTGVWDSWAAAALAFVIVFGTIIAFCAYLASTRYIRATETGTIASFEPLAAVVLSVWLLDVSFGPVECFGGLCIVSTVFLLSKVK